MKSQIFSLMLSAAVFTTCPLFAMENEDYSQECRSFMVLPSETFFHILDALDRLDYVAPKLKSQKVFKFCTDYEGPLPELTKPFHVPLNTFLSYFNSPCTL